MRRALISVFNKEGVIELVQSLSVLGWEIISTGGTYKLLAEAGIKNLKAVAKVSGFPEILDGRVKTLNPQIHGGILADRSQASHLKDLKNQAIEPIDLVAVNLYPFKETVSRLGVSEAEAIANIDIGGVAMIRAAAKNYQHVYVVVDPVDYQEVAGRLDQNELDFKRKLAAKAFAYTKDYDQAVAGYFAGATELFLNFKKVRELRYGENPHQRACLYQDSGQGIVGAEVLHGKELSYNNLVDGDSAFNLIREFGWPAAAVLKHTNPCGCAVAENIDQAYAKAYGADALSAFGGVIVLNRGCTVAIAEAINQVFAEMVIAPAYEVQALDILRQKKNIRILRVNLTLPLLESKDYKKIVGGILQQDFDRQAVTEKDLKAVNEILPTKNQLQDLLFGWSVVRHVKSNAVVLAKDGLTVGIGAGQMSRVDAVEIALRKAGVQAEGAVAASDAFFPFRDSLDKLAQNGVKSVIQPGGSLRDAEVIQACSEHKMSMVFTGFRAFRH